MLMHSTCSQRMLHFPFSTQGLFFISSGFRKGSSGMPSSIHFTNLQGEHGSHRAFLGHSPPSLHGFVAVLSPVCGKALPISAPITPPLPALCPLTQVSFWRTSPACRPAGTSGSPPPSSTGAGPTHPWRWGSVGAGRQSVPMFPIPPTAPRAFGKSLVPWLEVRAALTMVEQGQVLCVTWSLRAHTNPALRAALDLPAI